MILVKKETIKTKTFEEKIIKAIKQIKRMDMDKKTKDDVLEIMRALHNECLEWSEPSENFRIIEELRI